MTSSQVVGNGHGLGRAVRGAWGWWLSELRLLIPGFLAELVAPRRPGLRIAIEDTVYGFSVKRGNRWDEVARLEAVPGAGLGPSSEARHLADLARRKGMSVSLCVPWGQLVRRVLNYPATARRELRTILRHQIDRLIPYTADEVYFDLRAMREDHRAGRLEVELMAIPRSAVDRLIEPLAACGLLPETLELIPEAGGPARSIRLGAPGRPSLAGRLRNGLLVALVLINGLLTLALLGLPILDLSHRETRLKAQVATAESKVEVVSRLRELVEEIETESQYLVERRTAHPPKLEILTAVTRLLPDSVWLDQVSIRDEKVELKGYSANAAALIGTIERSPLFAEARFRAPVVGARDGRSERFHILADLTVEPGT